MREPHRWGSSVSRSGYFQVSVINVHPGLAWRQPYGQQLGPAKDAVLLLRKVLPPRRMEAKHCWHAQIIAGGAAVNRWLSTIDDLLAPREGSVCVRPTDPPLSGFGRRA